MTEEEFNTAITMMRNKYQSRISIAKSFLTPEQMKVFRSKPFVAERADKPRWCFPDNPIRKGDKRKPYELPRSRSITSHDLEHIDLPSPGGKWLGKRDWLHHSKVVMAQVLRIINGDHTAHYREIPCRKGYAYVDEGDKIT